MTQMAQQEHKWSSILDEWDEKSQNSSRFEWTTISKVGPIRAEAVIFEGFLFPLEFPLAHLRERKFCLSSIGLICYKAETSMIPQAYLHFNNPRLRPLNSDSPHFPGFELHGSQKTHVFHCSSVALQADWIEALRKMCVCEDITSQYILGMCIGHGNYSDVMHAKKKTSMEEVAIKCLKKERMRNNIGLINRVVNEINTLRKLSHKNIIRLYSVYENESTFFLVMEYAKGGSLLDRIKKKKTIIEIEAAIIVHSVLEAMNYCHVRQIVHLDLKLENIILLSEDTYELLKICDFGFASSVEQANKGSHKYGSPGYMAPEILKERRIDTKADIFSIGVIAYILLCGHAPFGGTTTQEIMEKNTLGHVPFPEEYWNGISEKGKNLVEQLLQLSPYMRPSASRALTHEWFRILKKPLATPLKNIIEHLSPVCFTKSQSPNKPPLIQPHVKNMSCFKKDTSEFTFSSIGNMQLKKTAESHLPNSFPDEESDFPFQDIEEHPNYLSNSFAQQVPSFFIPFQRTSLKCRRKLFRLETPPPIAGKAHADSPPKYSQNSNSLAVKEIIPKAITPNNRITSHLSILPEEEKHPNSKQEEDKFESKVTPIFQ